MRPEQFTKEARRWAADHQGDGEGDFRRQRAKRCVRIWDADDGMVRLHGVPACWDCHHKIHYRGWQIVTRNGQHTLHPPDPVHYGPARAPERPPPLFRPDNPHGPDLPSALFEPDTATPPPGGAEEKQPDDPMARCGPSTHGAPDSAGAGTPLTRSGPATARAALHNARSKHYGPPTEP